MEAKASNDEIVKTGDTVLVRESDTRVWFVSLFSYKIEDNYFICTNGSVWTQCIPLKNNEHLCGTNNEFKKPYTPKFGDKVEGITNENTTITGTLIGYNKNSPLPYRVCMSTVNPDGFITVYYEYCKDIILIKE